MSISNALKDHKIKTLYTAIVKPFFDKLAAAAILLITSPIVLMAMIALAISNRGKIWFLQERPGLHGSIFRVIKFKTMRDTRDDKGNLLPDEKRITTVGQFIRKSSIDELPQLINVLKGDMSIVGPRPLLVEYLGYYDDTQRRRHDVMPGITGWAQVNGRNAISWEKKFEFDVWYVDHISFTLDVKILFMTVFSVARAKGISSATSVTMEKFRGKQ